MWFATFPRKSGSLVNDAFRKRGPGVGPALFSCRNVLKSQQRNGIVAPRRTLFCKRSRLSNSLTKVVGNVIASYSINISLETPVFSPNASTRVSIPRHLIDPDPYVTVSRRILYTQFPLLVPFPFPFPLPSIVPFIPRAPLSTVPSSLPRSVVTSSFLKSSLAVAILIRAQFISPSPGGRTTST